MGSGGKLDNKEDDVEKKLNYVGVRHVQAFLMFLGMVFSFFLRVNISAAIVPMTQTQENGDSPKYDWSSSQKSLILSSSLWGFVAAQLPAGLLAKRYGAKIVFGWSTLLAALITCLHPIAVSAGNWQALCALRVLVGLLEGVVNPCLHALLAKWVPRTERGFIATTVYSGAQLGTAIILATSGIIFDSMGWPGIFYISGGIAFLWALLFLYYGAEEPAKSKTISKLEREYIESLTGSSKAAQEFQQLPVPWKSLFTSAPFIGLIFAHCGFVWGYYTLLTEIPTYLSNVHQLNVKSNALLSALPYFAMWILCLIISPISDALNNHRVISVSASRKLFNSIGQWVPMAGLIALAYMTVEQKVFAITLLTLSVGFNSASFCGFLVNHMDLSPNFAGVMMGITSTLSNLISSIAPLVVGVIVRNEKDPKEWRIVFFITASIYLFSNMIFVIFGKATVQSWNEPENLCHQFENVKGDEENANPSLGTVAPNLGTICGLCHIFYQLIQNGQFQSKIYQRKLFWTIDCFAYFIFLTKVLNLFQNDAHISMELPIYN